MWPWRKPTADDMTAIGSSWATSGHDLSQNGFGGCCGCCGFCGCFRLGLAEVVAEHLGVKTPGVPATSQPSMTKNSSSSRAPKNAHLPGDPGTGGKNAKVTHVRHFCVPSQLPHLVDELKLWHLPPSPGTPRRPTRPQGRPPPLRNCTCGTSRLNCLDHPGLSLHNNGRVPTNPRTAPVRSHGLLHSLHCVPVSVNQLNPPLCRRTESEAPPRLLERNCVITGTSARGADASALRSIYIPPWAGGESHRRGRLAEPCAH